MRYKPISGKLVPFIWNVLMLHFAVEWIENKCEHWLLL